MQRVSLEKAYILHRRPYSNTSLIVDFFTEKYGRLSAIARSARGLKSRYRSKLEPFVLMLISFSGRGELKTLGDVEISQIPQTLSGKALLSGFYLNEILIRLLQREDPYFVLFESYHQALVQLRNAGSIEIILRRFEKKLLQELGFGLSFAVDCVSKESIDVNAYYRYLPEQGFQQVQDHFEEMNTFSGASLLALHQDRFEDVTCLKDAKRLMRLALYSYLGNKPLKSRELF